MQDEISIGTTGFLHRDKYLFQEHRIVTALVWPIEKKIEWLDTVMVARAAYSAKLAQ
jgi:hypothetical protein